MAAVTHVDATASTANATSYPSASFTPPANGWLIVFVEAIGSVVAAPTLTASANGITFTRLTTEADSTGSVGSHIYIFVADQITGGSPVPMTVTFDCTGDTGAGCFILTESVSAMIRTGTSAVVQVGKVDEVPGGTPPVVPFGAAVHTANPTIFAHVGILATGVTSPSGMTEQYDGSIVTPSMGASIHTRNSGFTGTSLTLGSTAGACCAVAVEVDTSSTATVYAASGTIAVTSALVGNATIGPGYDGTFETGIGGWAGGGTFPPTLQVSTAEHHAGSQSMEIDWTTSTSGIPIAGHDFVGLTPGNRYAITAWVKVPAGTSPLINPAIGGVLVVPGINQRGAWQQVAINWVQVGTVAAFQFWPDAQPTLGDKAFVDDVVGPFTAQSLSASGTIAVVSGVAGNATRVLRTLAATGTIPVVSALVGNPVKLILAAGTIPVVAALVGDAVRIPFAPFVASGAINLAMVVSGNPTRITLTWAASGTIDVVSTVEGTTDQAAPAAVSGAIPLAILLSGAPGSTAAGAVLLRLVLEVGRDDHQRPPKGQALWYDFHYPPTQLALLLYQDGTVIPTWTLERHEYLTCDAVAAGGRDSIYRTDSWEAQVLLAAGYILAPVT